MPKNVRYLVLLLVWISNFQALQAQAVLSSAFAHNDYKHKRPLFDALNWGVANIEADVFLYKNKLVVAHVMPFFRASKTLEDLYFKPLANRYKLNNNSIYLGYNEPVVLMIDIKSNANKTYAKLKELLVKYQPMLTRYDNGVITPGAITVVISGHKPYQIMQAETSRLAFIDDDLKKENTTSYKSDLCLMASARFSKITSWDGKQPITDEQKAGLCAYISKAHSEGKKVRLWAIPQTAGAWAMLMKCGVDLINSDNLKGMNAYFTNKKLITNYSYRVNR